mgnify:CR=1 FL=1
MNITEILTQAQVSSDAVTDLLIKLAQQNKEITATAQHMCDLYFADVRSRENSIKSKITVLEKQQADLDAQIHGMQVAVVDAAGTGNADTFTQAQDKLANIEARKAAISTQTKMLRAAQVRGSEELYQAACDAYSNLTEANSAYEKALDKIHLVAEDQVKVWSVLAEKAEYSHWSANTGHLSSKGGKVRDFEKVREHHNAQSGATSSEEKQSTPVVNIELARYQVGAHPGK